MKANRRLPRNLKERGQPRQFDVSREDNQLKVTQFVLNIFSSQEYLPADLCERVFTPSSWPDALGCPIRG